MNYQEQGTSPCSPPGEDQKASPQTPSKENIYEGDLGLGSYELKLEKTPSQSQLNWWAWTAQTWSQVMQGSLRNTSQAHEAKCMERGWKVYEGQKGEIQNIHPLVPTEMRIYYHPSILGNWFKFWTVPFLLMNWGGWEGCGDRRQASSCWKDETVGSEGVSLLCTALLTLPSDLRFYSLFRESFKTLFKKFLSLNAWLLSWREYPFIQEVTRFTCLEPRAPLAPSDPGLFVQISALHHCWWHGAWGPLSFWASSSSGSCRCLKGFLTAGKHSALNAVPLSPLAGPLPGTVGFSSPHQVSVFLSLLAFESLPGSVAGPSVCGVMRCHSPGSSPVIVLTWEQQRGAGARRAGLRMRRAPPPPQRQGLSISTLLTRRGSWPVAQRPTQQLLIQLHDLCL